MYRKTLSINIRAGLLFFIILCTTSIQARGLTSENVFAIGISGSTAGLGGQLVYNSHPNFKLALIGQGFGYDLRKHMDDVDPELTITSSRLNMFTIGPALHFHPFENKVKIIVGLLYNQNNMKVAVRSNPQFAGQSITVQGVTFNANDLTNAKLSLHFNRLTPYLGMGYDNTFFTQNLSFFIEGGIFFQGKLHAKVDSTSGSQSLTNQVREALRQDIAGGANTLSLLQFYPIIRLGLNYAF